MKNLRNRHTGDSARRLFQRTREIWQARAVPSNRNSLDRNSRARTVDERSNRRHDLLAGGNARTGTTEDAFSALSGRHVDRKF
jgi:hypothetical protein